MEMQERARGDDDFTDDELADEDDRFSEDEDSPP